MTAPEHRLDAPPSLVVGEAACDAYLADHVACIASQVPEQKRAAMLAELSGKAQAWQRLADDPATRPGLPELCKAEQRHAMASLRKLGCEPAERPRFALCGP